MEIKSISNEIRKENFEGKNFYDELIKLRDQDRERRKDAVSLVRGKEIPWEVNKQGIMRWYLHPSINDTVLKSMLVFVQEIPPGSRTGKIKYQGGQVIYIMKGHGYSVLDGIKHYWQAGDVVQLPLRPPGVIYQHFNEDPNEIVRFIACEANVVDALSVDRGSGFEQLEECPEYKKR
ncbi:MAG: hypothetical protein Q7J85_11930 [Bacillota bacterium]|nr:hypothetical protein [Bacillota bacterium]